MPKSKLFNDEIVIPNSSESLIEFSAVPDEGAWTITIGDLETDSLDFNASAATIESEIRELAVEAGDPLGEAEVAGNYTDGFTIDLHDVLGPVEVGANTLENTNVAVTTTITFTNVYELDITGFKDLALGVYWGALPAGPEDLSLSASMDAENWSVISDPDSVVTMDDAGGSHIYNCSSFNFKYLKVNVPETDTTMEVRLQGLRFGI